MADDHLHAVCWRQCVRIQQKVTSMLSPTQSLILELLQAGKTDREIEAELNVSRGTLSTQIDRIKKKHGVRDRYDLPGMTSRPVDYQSAIVAMRHSGKSFDEIAIELNALPVTLYSVASRLRKRKLLMDKPHRSERIST
jgi:DNA-binding CsgD family transcriptional regulator